jgi:transposase InsO family protein
MQDDNSDHTQQLALFRYGLIADLVHTPPGEKGLYGLIQKKADKEYTIPGSLRTRVASETIRDWLKKYRKGGFDALLTKERNDRGNPRKITQDVADLLIAIKEETPGLSVRKVIVAARKGNKVSEEVILAPSTVHSLLAKKGLMKKKTDEPTDKDHRRFSYQYAGDLFMCDVMHGPTVRTSGNKRQKTYLIAFIDDATRVIPHAAFAMSESTADFMPVFKQAIMRRGIPLRLFVDNGAAFRSQHLALACAKLGITLIHARAYHAQAKGKIERWFRTVRLQFLPTLAPSNTESLEALNRTLWAYVEMEYHRNLHRMLQETPLDHWAKVGLRVRFPEPGLDLDDLFLFETKRKVQKDRTISLNGLVYEIEAALVDETVTLRYDPAHPGEPVQVWHQSQYIHTAKLVNAYANCFVKRNRPSLALEIATPQEHTEQESKQSKAPKHAVEFAKFSQQNNLQDIPCTKHTSR